MPDDLQTLTHQMRNCTLCKDLPLGPKPIFQLDPAVKILIVGHAPGRRTHAKSRPFDDPSGVRLRTWLGVDEPSFYGDKRIGLFPMGLCFPGSGPSGDKPPRPECAATWRAPVMAALDQVALTLVLGRYAVAWHLPAFKAAPLRDVVRGTYETNGVLLALPHPSPRNNRWLKQNPWFEADMIPHIQTQVAGLLRAD